MDPTTDYNNTLNTSNQTSRLLSNVTANPDSTIPTSANMAQPSTTSQFMTDPMQGTQQSAPQPAISQPIQPPQLAGLGAQISSSAQPQTSPTGSSSMSQPITPPWYNPYGVSQDINSTSPSDNPFPQKQVAPQGTNTDSSQGSVSYRNNNPLNIKYGDFAQQYGATPGTTATDGGQFATFPTVNAGIQAAMNLLQAKSYANLNLDQAMRRWSGHGYGADVAPNLDPNSRMADLTPDQLNYLVQSMQKREGWFGPTNNVHNTGKGGYGGAGGIQEELDGQGGPSNNFRNVRSAVKPNIPFRNLGNLTTNYNASTRDEPKHPGIDIANKKGTPIPAFTSGVVKQVVGGKKQGDKNYGNTVLIRDQDGNYHRYSHLMGEYVKVGMPVHKGQVIGSMGNSGNTYSNSGGDGTHLDYRIKTAYGKHMNPFQYFKRFKT